MIIYMSCYKIDNIIDVSANGDCMFESIWKSLDEQLREDIIKEVHDIIQKQEYKQMGMDSYLEEEKKYRYLRILCHFYKTSEEYPNVSTLRDKNVSDADKKIFDLNGKERWGNSVEIFIIQSFLEKQGHNIHIQVYEKENENDCYRLRNPTDKEVDKEIYLIYLIYVNKNHYKYTLSKPEKVDVGDVVGDAVEEGAVVGDDLGDGAVVEKVAVGVGGVKTNVAPMIVLSIFVLFMAAVSE
jgi:hypothetical protein